jgi:hypothetical protein
MDGPLARIVATAAWVSLPSRSLPKREPGRNCVAGLWTLAARYTKEPNSWVPTGRPAMLAWGAAASPLDSPSACLPLPRGELVVGTINRGEAWV